MSAPAYNLNLLSVSPLCELLDELRDRAVGMEGPAPARYLDASLYEPLREFLSVPGKELRGRLVRASYVLAGGRGEPPHALPWLVEMLHAGSLIIDDIEDDSELRRGRPALHRTHGVPLALNAGNWMYFWPLAELEKLGLPPAVELLLHRHMAKALVDCHRGQALDLSVRIGSLQPREVSAVVLRTTQLKTGTLMQLSASVGALAADAVAESLTALERFGHALGVALQMLDDLGGITSSTRRDKGLEDLRLGRPTWPWAWLAQEGDELAFPKWQARSREAAHDEAVCEALRHALAEHIGVRGTRLVHESLEAALSDLGHVLGPSKVLDELSRDVKRLEKSYG